MEQKTSGPNADIKVQAKTVLDKIMGLATNKYRFDFEIYGWGIGLAVLVLLIILIH